MSIGTFEHNYLCLVTEVVPEPGWVLPALALSNSLIFSSNISLVLDDVSDILNFFVDYKRGDGQLFE